MNLLVGYTGFVGSNLHASGCFDAVYHSKDIEEAYGKEPDLLVYAGLRAEKYLANHDPLKDMEAILQAEKNIAEIRPKKLVLISTIDVFQKPYEVDETTEIETEGLHPYGYNRYQLELWVREKFPDALIVRLPALFGKNIKKNFIYDFMNIIPFMLTERKMEELTSRDTDIKLSYQLLENGFYKLKEITDHEKVILKQKFKSLNFCALNFTDSRSRYQFYNLGRLWNDIQIALKAGILLWHPATEPVSAKELYLFLTGEAFVNELEGIPADYNYKTIYADVFGGQNGYICNKHVVMREIKEFLEHYEG